MSSFHSDVPKYCGPPSSMETVFGVPDRTLSKKKNPKNQKSKNPKIQKSKKSKNLWSTVVQSTDPSLCWWSTPFCVIFLFLFIYFVQCRGPTFCWGWPILCCFVFICFNLSSPKIQFCIGGDLFCTCFFGSFGLYIPGCYPRWCGVSEGVTFLVSPLMGSGLRFLLRSLCVPSTYWSSFCWGHLNLSIQFISGEGKKNSFVLLCRFLGGQLLIFAPK